MLLTVFIEWSWLIIERYKRISTRLNAPYSRQLSTNKRFTLNMIHSEKLRERVSPFSILTLLLCKYKFHVLYTTWMGSPCYLGRKQQKIRWSISFKTSPFWNQHDSFIHRFIVVLEVSSLLFWIANSSTVSPWDL